MKDGPTPERPPAAGPERLSPRGGRYVRTTIPTSRPAGPRLSLYALAVVVVLVAGALGWVKGASDRDGEAHSMLLAALAEVRAADADVERVARAVEDTLAPEPDRLSAGRAEASAKRARLRLVRAARLVEDARHEAKGDDRELAAALRLSAEGRLAMLDAAATLLPLKARAGMALAHAETGWGAMTRGAKLADQATEQFNRHTPDGVSRSTTLMRQAQAELSSASASFASAGRSMPEAGIGPMKEYADARRQMALKSIEVDGVWLRGEVGEANGMLVALTAEQAGPLAGKARALPRAADAPVREAYERLALPALTAYEDALAKSIEGDARLSELADSRVAQSSE